MKRYLVFRSDYYYPSGGWNDFRTSVDTLEEAEKYPVAGFDWMHIVDTQTMEIVAHYEAQGNYEGPNSWKRQE